MMCKTSAEVRDGAAPAGLKTALGQDVAAHMYTLPRIWVKACFSLFPLLPVLCMNRLILWL